MAVSQFLQTRLQAFIIEYSKHTGGVFGSRDPDQRKILSTAQLLKEQASTDIEVITGLSFLAAEYAFTCPGFAKAYPKYFTGKLLTKARADYFSSLKGDGESQVLANSRASQHQLTQYAAYIETLQEAHQRLNGILLDTQSGFAKVRDQYVEKLQALSDTLEKMSAKLRSYQIVFTAIVNVNAPTMVKDINEQLEEAERVAEDTRSLLCQMEHEQAEFRTSEAASLQRMQTGTRQGLFGSVMSLLTGGGQDDAPTFTMAATMAAAPPAHKSTSRREVARAAIQAPQRVPTPPPPPPPQTDLSVGVPPPPPPQTDVTEEVLAVPPDKSARSGTRRPVRLSGKGGGGGMSTALLAAIRNPENRKLKKVTTEEQQRPTGDTRTDLMASIRAPRTRTSLRDASKRVLAAKKAQKGPDSQTPQPDLMAALTAVLATRNAATHGSDSDSDPGSDVSDSEWVSTRKKKKKNKKGK